MNEKTFKLHNTPEECEKALQEGQIELAKLNLQKYVEKKGEKGKELSYLSWSYAWKKFLEHFPLARYIVEENENGLPYFYDEGVGYIVKTRVFPTPDNALSRSMWLPVMDGANKAMKKEPYTYTVKRWDSVRRQSTQIEKQVEAADMFDINKTIMRCLVKNLAMFGLGIYIYAGEDLPEALDDVEVYEEMPVPVPARSFARSKPVEKPKEAKTVKNTETEQKPAETAKKAQETAKKESESESGNRALTDFEVLKIEQCKSIEQLKAVCRKIVDDGASLDEVKNLCNKTAKRLSNATE